MQQEHDNNTYKVHPSYNSLTSIKVTRTTQPRASRSPIKNTPENPYTYKPKSYSKKRSTPTFQEQIIQIQPTKKFKAQSPLNFHRKKQVKNDLALLANEFTKSLEQPFFSNDFDRWEQSEAHKVIKYPLDLEVGACESQLLSRIEIVTTQNQKTQVEIHDSILKANTSHQKADNLNFLNSIQNPLDLDLREKYKDHVQFVRDYKSGYAPIEMQNKSKKDEQNDLKQELNLKKQPTSTGERSHFIRKKQSTLSLPRSCGVSYVRESESKQKHPYEPLEPLIFQCSSSCNYTSDYKEAFHTTIQEFIQACEKSWLPFIQVHQDKMRRLLLGERLGKVRWVAGINNIWPYYNESSFILILFSNSPMNTQEDVWNNMNSCPFKFGILSKKSTSGRKLFFKSIKGELSENTENEIASENPDEKSRINITENMDSRRVEDEEEKQQKQEQVQGQEFKQNFEQKKKAQCQQIFDDLTKQYQNSRTILTMSLKFQMYVNQKMWKGMGSNQQNLLNGIIVTLQEYLQKKVIEIIRLRFNLSQVANKNSILKGASQLIRKETNNCKKNVQTSQKLNENINFSLDSFKFLIASLKKFSCQFQQKDLQKTSSVIITQFFRDKEDKENQHLWEKSLKMPIYYISTRDSFAFDLIQKIAYFNRDGRIFKRIDYYFDSQNLPSNYGQYQKLFPDFHTGITCYHDFYTHQELCYFEENTFETEKNAFKSIFIDIQINFFK